MDLHLTRDFRRQAGHGHYCGADHGHFCGADAMKDALSNLKARKSDIDPGNAENVYIFKIFSIFQPYIFCFFSRNAWISDLSWKNIKNV